MLPVLSIGAVGHRRLSGVDPVPLKAAAGAVFAAIRGRSGAVRLRCICNAAAGADTILGEAAMALGFDLLCLLPAPREIFASDFFGEAERAAFEALLAAAAAVEEPEASPAGPNAYLAAARRLLSRTQILLAVWDGRPERGIGGTGQIVREACQAGLPTLVIDPAPPHEVTLAGLGAPGGLPAAIDDWLAAFPKRVPPP